MCYKGREIIYEDQKIKGPSTFPWNVSMSVSNCGDKMENILSQKKKGFQLEYQRRTTNINYRI